VDGRMEEAVVTLVAKSPLSSVAAGANGLDSGERPQGRIPYDSLSASRLRPIICPVHAFCGEMAMNTS